MNTKSEDAEAATCVIVGGGPAGMILAYLLARRGVSVTLLEAHGDFDRAFRGDTVHPSTLELLEKLGLVDRLLELPHTRIGRFEIQTPSGTYAIAEFSRLKTRFPYIALIDQARFLDFLAGESKAFPNLTIRMGAAAKELIEEQGKVCGVRYQDHAGLHAIKADLVIAADGRHSLLRKRAGFEPKSTSAPMDVLWFRLPKGAEIQNRDYAVFRAGRGHATVVLDRGTEWQVAFIIRKGGFHELKEQGLENLKAVLGGILPDFTDSLAALTEWKQISVLLVEANRLERWYQPGLLFIGDAAHAMSPVGGVGINYAIQDAVVAANVLAEPLRTGSVDVTHLADVQHRRERAVRFIQKFQSLLQRRIVAGALDPAKTLKIPWLMRLPFLRRLMAYIIGYGVFAPRLDDVDDAPVG